jgi:cellulose synthase/poly-beta-1,6-N-acetylglucosamine synthase-like glycosyltransferase
LAIIPFFVLSPTSLLALIGKIRGPRPVQDPDPVLVDDLAVDVVIPAHNEAGTIALCLASVVRQTKKPNSITVIDDGSSDETAAIAQAFASANNIAVRIIRRRRPIGKTPGLKIESRNLEGDVEFILDGDTILESPDYIEKTVQQLYRVPGIAAAFGMVNPLRERDRAAVEQFDTIRQLKEAYPSLDITPKFSPIRRLARGITNLYRDALYEFIQKFLYSGLQNLYGSVPNPIGCAVAYRREYLKELFDRYEPEMGDNLTSSEDIFFGSAFAAQGYHCRQVPDVVTRSEEPEFQSLPRQLVKWTSAWFQTSYRLPVVLSSPFKVVKRIKHRRANRDVANRRRVVDGYRQSFGMQVAERLGRPSGWANLFVMFEKVSFVIVLLTMIALEAWLPLAITIGADLFFYMVILAVFSDDFWLKAMARGAVVTPIRYATLLLDLVTIVLFVFDLATGRRHWRK